MSFLFLIIGLALVIKGADFLVDGGSSIAKRYGVSELLIGLTIVAFGTSLPELVVSIIAGFTGSGELTVGNVLGSNIANILLILGITAIINPIAVTSSTIWREIPFSMLGVVVFAILANDKYLTGASFEMISSADGFILLCFFLIYGYYMFGLTSAGRKEDDDGDIEQFGLAKSIIYVIIGVVGLMIGGQLTVMSAEEIAGAFGLSDAVIGLTVVAIGTSLPELVTSIVAAFKGKEDLIVGNIVGSNIFNIFWILGLSSALVPITINTDITIDMLVLVVATLSMFISLFIGKTKSHIIDKFEGGILLFMFIAYIVYNVARVL